MPRPERRVVITGLGIVSPIGSGSEAYWAALSSGKAGVDTIRSFPVEGLPTNVGGEVKGFDPAAWIAPRDIKFAD